MLHTLLLSIVLQGPPQRPPAGGADGAPEHPGASVAHRGSDGDLAVTPPRMDTPEIRIDGVLDEAAWQRAALLTGFTQYEPAEGLPATDPTDVRVFYATDALYVAIRAHDSEPEAMRARLGERDAAYRTDDWVRVMLDTFDDRRQAYVFYVTPLGIQADGVWVEGGANTNGGSVPVDYNPDYIWDAETRRDAGGWTAELRIPYISLRFRTQPVQDWGFDVARQTRRNGYKTSWSPVTQDRASTLAQIGRLRGLQELRPKRLVEVNPVLTGRRTGERTDAGWERADPTPELGLNARLGVTQNLVLDATLNPDFSQVEADADQITANERFALSVPEKRPFFLEGTEIFQTPQRLVYTRSIRDPAGGAKMTGKLGPLGVGYMGALDQAGDAGDAAVNLVRLRSDVGAGSSVGALLTSRMALEGRDDNQVAALDARLLFRERYTLTAQLARSWTRDTAAASGNLAFLSLARSGQKLGWELVLEDIAPDFDAQSGFIRRRGDTRIFGAGELTFHRAPGSLLEGWGGELRVERFYRHGTLTSGPAYEAEIELQPRLSLRGGSSVSMILRRGYYAFDPRDYAGFQTLEPGGTLVPMAAPRALDAMYAFALMPSLRPVAWAELGGRMYLREIPIYAEGSRGFEFLLSPSLKLWPSEGLSLDFAWARSRLWRRRDDTLFATQDIPRLRTQYQFSRALLARVVLQYNLQSREPLSDPATGRVLHYDGAPSEAVSQGEFGGQLLLSYEPSPGTLFYVGWAQHLRGPHTLHIADMERMSDGIFVKLSYLHRL